MNRINFINRLNNSEFYWEHSSLINALIASLSPREACSLLDIHFEQDFGFRKSILRKIVSDMNTDLLDLHISLVRQLMITFDSLPYSRKNACSHALGYLYPSMPQDLRIEVVQFLLSSIYKSVRRKAYKLMQSDWTPEYEPLLVKGWDWFKEIEGAHLIVEKLTIYFIKDHFNELKDVMFEAGPRHLSHLYIKVGENKSEIVEELRTIDEITYGYVCSKIGKMISDDEALLIFETNRSDNRIGLLLWSYGQLGLWEVLEQIAGRVFELDNERFQSFLKTDND